MRKITVTNLEGERLGSITETDEGTLEADGKGLSLIEQAPGKTFDDWLEANHHSKYLRFVEESEAPATSG